VLEGCAVVGRSRTSRVLVNLAMVLALLVSACSSGAASAPSAAQPTQNPPGTTPASAANPAAQPAAPATSQPNASGQPTASAASSASGQPEQRSVQAGGDPGGPVSDAPAAPIVARSRTTGRPITIEVWLTDWEQSTQQLFNDQLV